MIVCQPILNDLTDRNVNKRKIKRIWSIQSTQNHKKQLLLNILLKLL